MSRLRHARAQKLSPDRPPLVGVIVDGVSSYGRSVLRGVMRYANLQRKWLIHEDLWRVTGEATHWPGCDGVIVAGADKTIQDFVIKRCPFVVSCSGSVDPSLMPAVALDDHAAGRLAAEHLIDCGLTHFAFYGALQVNIVAVARLTAFSVTLAARGYQCQVAEVAWPSGTDMLTHSHRKELMAWLHALPKPVGIMATDDFVAHDLAGACMEAGIAVPEKVAIIGVNNDDLLCEAAWPPLSSINCDYSRMGYLAAKMLERMMAGEVLSEQERAVRLPPLGVTSRASTDVLAVDDPNLADALRFIRHHACDPCSVDDVLREVPVNRRWLERQFTAQLGRTLHEEITRVKVDAARRMLLQPELALVHIAERCGFSTVQAFNRAFSRAMGVTPAVYRRTSLPRGS